MLAWSLVGIFFSLAQCIILVALEADLLASVLQFFRLGVGSIENAGTQAILVVYIVLFMAGQITYSILTLNASFSRNSLQVMAASAFNALLFVYSIVQFLQVEALATGLELCLGIVAPSSRAQVEHLQLCIQPTTTGLQAIDLIKSTLSIRISIIALSLAFSLIGFFLAYRAYLEFGWSVWQQQGADIRKRNILRLYHIFLLLLKVNVYFLYVYLR